MPALRRDKLFIIAQIMEIAQGGSLKHQIMYGANLSFTNLQRYLSQVIDLELLEIRKEKGREIFVTTPKGLRFLDSYRRIQQLLADSSREECPKCGKKISPDFRLCPYCGTNLLAIYETQAPEVRRQ